MEKNLEVDEQVYKHEIEGYGDKCGVFAVYAPGENVAEMAYKGLYAIKNRGQDAAGIDVVSEAGFIHDHKDLGRVDAVFHGGESLPVHFPEVGRLATGHVRYGTMNKLEAAKRIHAAQPLDKDGQSLDGTPFIISGLYNGDVTNIGQVANAHDIDFAGFVSDSEGVMSLLQKYMSEQQHPDLVRALEWLLPQLEGAFSAIFTDGDDLLAARDGNGFRPFVYGKTTTESQVIASEVHALSAVQAEFNGEIEPGTICKVDEGGVKVLSRFSEAEVSPCAYEYIYFSKEDNIFHGRNIGAVREQLGLQLAKEHPYTDVDLWVGVPNSGITSAQAYADALKIPYEQVITINPEFTSEKRSFIGNNQTEREAITRAKQLVDEDKVRGKRIGVSDDSIIRGTVKRALIEMLREAGATEVHVRIPSPVYEYSCKYGMDTGRREELLKYNRTLEEMRQYIGADSLEYLSPEGTRLAITGAIAGKLCLACATGDYPTEVPVSITK
jgi:amidophosphoribosyltransferase